MAKKINDGGLATDTTLRDLFAAQAMAGVITHMPWPYEDVGRFEPEYDESVAAVCYAIADSMLKARESTPLEREQG